jgi:tight adherence protein C
VSTMLLPLLAFLFGTLIITAGAMALMPRRASAIERRLEELAVIGGADQPEAAPWYQSLVGLFKRTIFFGIRVTFALVLFGILSTPVFMRPNLTVALGGLGFGYLLPGMVLARKAKRRAHRIRLALADMLDLLVVSVEAGLGLDQAIARVSAELTFAYPELSDELRLINLELRAGKARSEALRNLADRTGVEDLSSLVTMLIQTDKFGTSVAQSLRVYSETLRTKRRQRAEEAAAKTGVKMVFPLVFCIFPAIWVVTIGPAAIRFVTVLFPLIERTK